ncbi:ABC transporter substrate-binding protein [Frondihabitans cladoniiphilus]|uniref:Solute-binding protein family 5 domain-containing protein n=1 Tax=Frondihabitans cladoniiphilus TaxID=715785 RepID=A0ABP8W4E2_9MICO
MNNPTALERLLAAPVSRRKLFITGGLTLATTGLLAACSTDGSGTSASASGAAGAAGVAGKSTITVAAPTLVTTFVPDGGGASGALNDILWPNLGAGLIRFPYKKNKSSGEFEQDAYHFEGWLADTYEISADGKTVTFHLNKTVTSTNGNPFTADDVLFSQERRMLSPYAVRRAEEIAAIPDMNSWSKIDDHTVSLTITDKKWQYLILNTLAVPYSGYIYDSVLMKAKQSTADPYAVVWSKSNYNNGFGAYKVTSVVPNQSMTWEARSDAVFGEAKIKKITFTPVADAGTRASTLISGDIDASIALQPADMASMLTNKALSVPEYSNPSATANLGMVTSKGPFADELVRQALCYAVPYQQIIDNVYHGRAKKTVGYLNPSAPGFTEKGLPVYDYDIAKSKSLLKKAGKTSVSFEVAYSNAAPDMQAIAVQIQSYAKAAGFTVTLKAVPDSDFYGNLSKHAYDSFLYRVAIWSQDPAQQLVNYVNTTPDYNFTDYRVTTSEDLAAKSYDEPAFSKAAGALWNEAEKGLLEAAPLDFIVRVQPLNAFTAGLKGVPFRYDYAVDFAAITI